MLKLYRQLLNFIPLICLVGICNYLVDPANLFREYERGIGEILLAGKNVANVLNCDERLVQHYVVDGLRRKNYAVVVGSSRTLQIGGDLFPGRTFFNHSVSGAVIEDDLAVYQMYREKNLLPSVMILGLDPWLLNKNHGQSRWKSVAGYCRRIDRELAVCTTGPDFSRMVGWIPDRYWELFSIAYFQASLKKLASGESTRQEYRATALDAADCPVKLADGSYVYGREFRGRGREAVRREARAYVAEEPVYSLGNFQGIDAATLGRLDAFLGMLKRDKVTVTLFLSPYHPETYAFLRGNVRYRIVAEVEQVYRQLADRHKLRLLGSFDPATAGLDEDDFYDAMHVKRSGIKKIFAKDDYAGP